MADEQDPTTEELAALRTRKRAFRSPPTSPGTCAPEDDRDYPENKNNLVRCTAHPKKLGGLRCRNWSLPGRDRCAGCGGNSPFAKIKARRYGAALNRGTLAEAYERHLADDDFKSVRDELALVRSFTEAAVMKMNGLNLDQITPVMQSVLVEMCREVRELVDAATRIDQKISVSLTVTDVHGIVVQVFDIITRYVEDPQVLLRIGQEIQELALGDPRPLKPDEYRGTDPRLVIPPEDPDLYRQRQAEEEVP